MADNEKEVSEKSVGLRQTESGRGISLKIKRRPQPPAPVIVEEEEPAEPIISKIDIKPPKQKKVTPQPEAPTLAPNQIGFKPADKPGVTKLKRQPHPPPPVVVEEEPPPPTPVVSKVGIKPMRRQAVDAAPEAPTLAPNQIAFKPSSVLAGFGVEKPEKVNRKDAQKAIDLAEQGKIVEGLKWAIALASASAATIERILSDERTLVDESVEALRNELLPIIEQLRASMPQPAPEVATHTLANPALTVNDGAIHLDLTADGSYDNSVSGLRSKNVQSAIDELVQTRKPSSVPGNQLTLDEAGHPLVPGLVLSSAPSPTMPLYLQNGVLNISPRVVAHLAAPLSGPFEQGETEVILGWITIVDSLRKVEPMTKNGQGAITIPRRAYYRVWASSLYENPGPGDGSIIRVGKTKLAQGDGRIEWRGFLDKGDVLRAYVATGQKNATPTALEFGIDLLLEDNN